VGAHFLMREICYASSLLRVDLTPKKF
jgi:hypothetical protein